MVYHDLTSFTRTFCHSLNSKARFELSTLLAGNSQSSSRPLKLNFQATFFFFFFENFQATLMLEFIKIACVFLLLTIFENTIGSLLAPPIASKVLTCEFLKQGAIMNSLICILSKKVMCSLYVLGLGKRKT